ncbi:MAG: hypothetical protein ACLUKN_06530 [Bacilli bacterium]
MDTSVLFIADKEDALKISLKRNVPYARNGKLSAYGCRFLNAYAMSVCFRLECR